MNIVDAIRIQHFKAESQQRRISSIFFLQNCARYFQQQDDLHSWFTLCYAHLVQTVQDIFYPEQQYEVHSLFTLCYAHQVGWQYLHCTTENNKPGQTPFNTGSKANTAEMQQQKKE